MDLNRWVLVRHAPASPRDFSRWPDDRERPLRASGRKEFRQSALGLSTLLMDPGCIASSPFLRARETALLVSQALGPQWPVLFWDELVPDANVGDLFERARKLNRRGDTVLVGHEPLLSRLVGYCLTGTEVSVLKFSKGGAVSINFPEKVTPSGGQLEWALTRKQLARLSSANSKRSSSRPP